ncbi:Hsp70 family protein, partial [Mycobacterium tuberculosis]|nr:Hsp70 family protein [Mycobacterium tuberculosis]
MKRALSAGEEAVFRFEGGDLSITVPVTRAAFEEWIAPDMVQIAAAVDRALAAAGLEAGAIDRVFLTGGTSLTPRVRRL